MTIKTINTIEVGDVVVEMWGTVLATPRTVIAVHEGTFNGKAIRHSVRADGGCFWPARDNDHRPVVVR